MFPIRCLESPLVFTLIASHRWCMRVEQDYRYADTGLVPLLLAQRSVLVAFCALFKRDCNFRSRLVKSVSELGYRRRILSRLLLSAILFPVVISEEPPPGDPCHSGVSLKESAELSETEPDSLSGRPKSCRVVISVTGQCDSM